MRIEKRKLIMHVYIEYIHNHVPYSAESLSFRPVSKITQVKYIELFKNDHSPAAAIYEDSLHLATANEKELITLLADRATNPTIILFPNYNLFKKYRKLIWVQVMDQGCLKN